MIRFENVTKEFLNRTTALHEVTFHIEPGEFVFIVGPSGAGKTTILRLMIKELFPTSGTIAIAEKELASIKKKDLHKLRRMIGAVFQDYKLLEDRTAEENVALISEMMKTTQEEVAEHVDEVLKLVGLDGKQELFPSQLSGGELQRTAIARALTTKPHIIFADEPTGNLDQATSWEIMNLLLKINKEGTTILIATHNQEITKTLDKRIIELDNGRIVKDTKKPTVKKKKDNRAKPEKRETEKKDEKDQTKKTSTKEDKKITNQVKVDKKIDKKKTEK